jgi:hypothetical protein
MKEGLLWFDNDPRHKLTDKVRQAATRYQVKFGRKPTVCYVNGADLDGQTEAVNGVQLRTASNVLRHHLWIGTEQESTTAKAA